MSSIVIRRQSVDAQVRGSEALALDVQRRLADVCAGALPRAIEDAVRGMDVDGRHLRIDRLNVEVVVPTPEELEFRLVGEVGSSVREALFRGPEIDTFGTGPHTGEPTSSPASELPDGSPHQITELSASDEIDDALSSFLQNGRLPWWFRLPAGAALETHLVEVWNKVRGSHPPAFPLTRTALAEVGARIRLLSQFSPGFVTALLDTLSPGASRVVVDALTILDVPGPLPTPDQAERTVWLRALEMAAAGIAATTGELLRSAEKPDAPSRPATEDQAVHSPHKGEHVEVSGAAPDGPWRDIAQAPGPESIRDGNEQTGATSDPTRAELASGIDKQSGADLEEGIFVDNAGVVLLHPFLPRFFEGLGVASDDRLLDPDRALSLLHHLATGELTAPEHRLTLGKVLCGLPLDMPVTDVVLDEEEFEETDALLTAVIGHWSALGGTSPDGLRGEFLTRDGLLRRRPGDNWELRVETRASDILLAHLPWGISQVRLPWMRTPLLVEWG